jgi:hypothetical protein
MHFSGTGRTARVRKMANTPMEHRKDDGRVGPAPAWQRRGMDSFKRPG